MVSVASEPTVLYDASLAPWIIALPAASAAILLLFGRRIGGAIAGWIATLSVAAAFVVGLLVFTTMMGAAAEHGHNDRSATVDLFEWIAAGNFSIAARLLVDQLSMTLVLVVTGVGALIHLYSIGYMEHDPRRPRYFAYLNLFVAAMLVLVLADNLLVMFVGWEGVGLCSYLLIGFWFEKPYAATAAKKAFVVNRIGDFSFLLGIFLLWGTVGSLSFGDINLASAEGAVASGVAVIAALLLFGGAAGKSAQIPLYVWLPDAMAGPTPVSALIHAATMVTAGVYMVARLSPLYEAAGSPALLVVAWIGAATALLAAVIAAGENDIKKVLAYSTVSQLGYMFLALGVGAYSIAVFHLVTHAFFKALMFLGAGAVMHGLNDETDIRRMGGLRKVMPLTGWTFMMGWLAISGIVPFAGFFSKDAILAAAWADGQYALWAVGAFTALLTAFYMSRLYLRVFEGKLVVPQGAHPHDPPWTIAAALVPLAVLSVVGGFINLPEGLPGALAFEHFLDPVLGPVTVPHGAAAWLLATTALVVAAAGILIARALYLGRDADYRRGELVRRLRPLVTASREKFYVDRTYETLVLQPAHDLAAFSADVVDRKVIDGAVNGTAVAVAGLGEVFRRVQTGYVRSYAALFLVGVVVLFSIVVLRVGT
jgi:NADH-quinone oxidoreductase subunit L